MGTDTDMVLVYSASIYILYWALRGTVVKAKVARVRPLYGIQCQHIILYWALRGTVHSTRVCLDAAIQGTVPGYGWIRAYEVQCRAWLNEAFRGAVPPGERSPLELRPSFRLGRDSCLLIMKINMSLKC